MRPPPGPPLLAGNGAGAALPPAVFLASDSISWNNGWVQGAMESGLRAAYQCHLALQ
jgi:monoamine oxidase